LSPEKTLFFIALLPPLQIQEYANEIKQYFADKYASKHAQKSPPHITLQPPFNWADSNVTVVEECLTNFARGRSSVPITLSGFAAFAPRVIYINVVRNQELLTLHADLMVHVESQLGIVDKVGKKRPFAPHMTVAFRDLTRQNFQAAWQEFQHRELYFEFTASELTLLRHDGRRWNVKSQSILDFSF